MTNKKIIQEINAMLVRRIIISGMIILGAVSQAYAAGGVSSWPVYAEDIKKKNLVIHASQTPVPTTGGNTDTTNYVKVTGGNETKEAQKAISWADWVSSSNNWKVPNSYSLVPGMTARFTLQDSCLVHILWNGEVTTGVVPDSHILGGESYINPIESQVNFKLFIDGNLIQQTTVSAFLPTKTSAVIQTMQLLPAGEHIIEIHGKGSREFPSFIDSRYMSVTAFNLSQVNRQFRPVPVRPSN